MTILLFFLMRNVKQEIKDIRKSFIPPPSQATEVSLRKIVLTGVLNEDFKVNLN